VAKPAPPITGTGTVSCKATGKLIFATPLVNGGTASNVPVTVRANLVGCTGTLDGATVSMGKATGTATLATNDCSSLSAVGPFDVTVKWKTTGHSPHLDNSTVSLSATLDTSSGQAVIDATGSATAGSFTGDAAAAHAVVTKSLTALGNACAGKGLRSVSFAASSSTASLS
jgi:hypothetical protein